MVPRYECPSSVPSHHSCSSSRQASSHHKSSRQSPTPSFEADDEHSITTSEDSMSTSDAMHQGIPQFPGEDTRMTSRKELSGWYSYGWAAEVFVICGAGSFIPITLEQLARERGYLLSDPSRPCGASFDTTSRSSNSPSRAIMMDRTSPKIPNNGQCIINFLGAEINTASFAMYTFSLSVLVQALLIISMSGAADHGKVRKSLLLTFAFIGASATMLFLAVVPKVYVLGAVLAIIANTCVGSSFVLLNSFLPVLVRHHPSIQPLEREDSDTTPGYQIGAEEYIEVPSNAEANDLQASIAALLPSSNPCEAKRADMLHTRSSPELQLSTKISSYGIGIGYIAGLVVQTLGILLILFTGSNTFSLRLVLFVIGLWWFAFTIPAALWLRPRPGPPIPFSSKWKRKGSWLGYIAFAWNSLGKTAMKARHLKDMILFLTVWFLLSDGIATVGGTAVLFAKTQLQMKPVAIAMINIIATLAGVLGAFTWSSLSRRFNARPSQTIIACIFLFEVIPLYGLLGYVPIIRKHGVFGLQQPWEMYPIGAIYGFVLGGLSSYCRSFFGELIPPGFEAAFYALYAITDKGSSIFGPAIVGAITDRYGEIRPAFVFLAVLIFVPLPLMMLVDVDRGKREALLLGEQLARRKGHGASHAADAGTIVLFDDEVEHGNDDSP